MVRAGSFLIISVMLLSCGNNNTSENNSIPQDTTVIPTTSSTRITITDTIDLNPNDAGNEKRSPQNADTVRFMVAFISKGMGIDLSQKQKLDVWLAKQNVQYSVSPWGREGEMNYCFPLKNTSATDQQKFISELKSQITKRDLVYFYENTACSK
jgi:hypothetical protein